MYIFKRIKNESGRSMTEMLGVLAIVGLLSMGALAGYQYAMTQWRAREFLDEANRRALHVSDQITMQTPPTLDAFKNNNLNGGVFDTKVYGLDGTTEWTQGDQQFTLLISNVGGRVCDQMKDSADANIKIFMPETCNMEDTNVIKLTYNNDLSTAAIDVPPVTQPPSGDEEDDGFTEAQVFLATFNDSKLPVIKVVREYIGVGLKESKDLVEQAPVVVASNYQRERAEQFKDAINAAGGTAVVCSMEATPYCSAREATQHKCTAGACCRGQLYTATGTNGADQCLAAPPTGYQVYLVSTNNNKLTVMKAIKAKTGLGLAEAKALVESAPAVVGLIYSAEEADQLKNAIIEAGGNAIVCPENTTPYCSSPNGDGTCSAGACCRGQFNSGSGIDAGGQCYALHPYTIFIRSYTGSALEITKVLMTHFGFNLSAAHNLVKSAPVEFTADLGTVKAEEIKQALTSAGAVVNVCIVGSCNNKVDVYLASVDPTQKINTIKVVRGYLGLGLKEAKDLIDSAPVMLTTDFDFGEAQRFRDALYEVDADVELR